MEIPTVSASMRQCVDGTAEQPDMAATSMNTLSAYELIRRGEPELLPTVVNNLRGYFHSLPDTEALAKLAGTAWEMPSVPPLLLEGFQALDLMAQRPNVPPGETLVFRGPWTMWRGLANQDDPR